MKSDDPTPIEELLEQAPQLQRLAARLARGWDQDDLVQETWLRTLQSPPKNRRNLRSWLTGSLRHRAADHHRREASQRERVERLEEATAGQPQHEQATPAELLARTEAHQAVVECLNDLEDPFRHALILHYFDGLSVTEIASKLGAPKPTISSRLKRGRERLREMMQARYGGQAFGLCMTAAGPFAPVIATAAPADSTPTVGIPSFGIALVAVALIVGALAIWMPRPDPVPIASTEVLNASLDPSPELSSLKAEAAEASSDSNRMRQESGPAMNLIRTIRGRCVSSLNQTPLVGAPIELTWMRSESTAVDLYTPRDWVGPTQATTGSDGEFEIQFTENWGQEVRITIRPDGHAPRTGDFPASSTSPRKQDLDLGVIEFLPGHRVQGKVVDHADAPVSGMVLIAADLPFAIEQSSYTADSSWGKSDANGRFELSELVPLGNWNLEGRKRFGLSQDGEVRFTVSETGVDQSIVVRAIRQEYVIKGTVLDENGLPAPRVHLAAYAQDRPIASEWSWPDGTFELYHSQPTGPVTLSFTSDETESWSSESPIEWGTENVVIQVRRNMGMQVRAIHEQTGAPIEDYSVMIMGMASRARIRHEGEHSDGVLMVQPVPTTEFAISVVPRQRGLLPSNWIQVDPNQLTEEPLEIPIQQLESTEIYIADKEGAPIQGSRIEVIEANGDPLKIDSSVWNIGRHQPDSGHVPFSLIDQARSNADGIASLFAAEDLDLGIRITGDHPPVVVYPFDPSSESAKHVVVEPDARLTIKLTRPTAWQHAGVFFDLDDSHFVWPGSDAVHWFSPDGELQVALPPAGRYLMKYAVEIENAPGGVFGSPSELALIDIPLDIVTFSEGERRELVVDPSQYEPGSLRGRILIDGVPATGGYVQVVFSRQATLIPPQDWDQEGIGNSGTDLLRVDAEGYFETPEILPGTVAVYYRSSKERESGTLSVQSMDFTTVLSDQKADADFHIEFQGIRVLIRKLDGTPLAKTRLGIEEHMIHDSRSTDENGLLVLDGVPPQGVRIRGEGLHAIYGTVKPEPGQRWTELELTLPE